MDTPKAVVPRDRVLADAELARVWLAAGNAGKLFGPIVRLLIATGQRREEVSALDWSELDKKDRLWTLPKERAKNGITHLIPLNDCALGVLDQIAGGQTEWPQKGLVFATSGGKRYIAHSKGKQQLDKILRGDGHAEMSAWRLHDLRRTLATGFQKLGVRFEVTEDVLNHLSGAKAGVGGTYQRHDWATEKRQALDQWSKSIRIITTGAPINGDMPMLSDVERAFRSA
jgi:integrase